MKRSKKWNEMALLYKRFAADWANADFSEEAADEAYAAETHGTPCDPMNGYALGKKWMNVTIAAWRQDLNDNSLPFRSLFITELLTDGYPEKFLIANKLM